MNKHNNNVKSDNNNNNNNNNNNKNTNNNTTHDTTINFALRIQLTQGPSGNKYEIKSRNQGIPDSEIILIVENWVEQVKKAYKSQLGNINFIGNGK